MGALQPPLKQYVNTMVVKTLMKNIRESSIKARPRDIKKVFKRWCFFIPAFWGYNIYSKVHSFYVYNLMKFGNYILKFMVVV